MRILISGASGLIGSALVPALRKRGHDVVRLVRKRPDSADAIFWDPEASQLDLSHSDPFDAVINLSGENIGESRWTKSRKRKLLESRIKSTDLLARTIAELENPPSLMISASARDY